MSSVLYDGAIQTTSVADPHSFIENLFPDKAIFGPWMNLDQLSEFWQSFNNAHPAAWADILTGLRQANGKNHMAAFLNLLSRHSSSSNRLWSAANKDKPAGGDVNCKPDLVCYDPLHGNDPLDWSQFTSVSELKCGEYKDVYGLLLERAVVLFRSQDSHCFVLTFTIVKGFMTVALFDRGGSIVSDAFDIQRN